VFAESKYPSNTFLAARTAVNCLLDSLMRGWSLPLTIARMDLHLDEEEEPICHQLVLPFAQRVRLDPLGGVHQFPPLAAHESMLREAITATSPFYRFLCAYRLYEGIQPLRKWLRDVAKRLNVSVKLPKPPRIDPDALRRYGFTPDFVKGVRTTEDVWEKMNDHRDRVAHFLTKKGGAALPFHDGRAYLEYSLCGAFLLKCSHEAFRELWLYFSKHLNGLLTLGSVLPIIEQRGDFILRPDTPSDQPRFRAKKR
jgi:hypothetical protein